MAKAKIRRKIALNEEDIRSPEDRAHDVASSHGVLNSASSSHKRPRAKNDPDNNVGIYDKFTVTRNDGSSVQGGKHYLCKYFVLDLIHDANAKIALLAYAGACEDDYPELSKDILKLCEVM